jgi:hypothetical protein
MPVLRQHDVAKPPGDPVDRRHDRVAVIDRQSATRAEIILHVNDEKQVVMGANLHL